MRYIWVGVVLHMVVIYEGIKECIKEIAIHISLFKRVDFKTLARANVTRATFSISTEIRYFMQYFLLFGEGMLTCFCVHFWLLIWNNRFSSTQICFMLPANSCFDMVCHELKWHLQIWTFPLLNWENKYCVKSSNEWAHLCTRIYIYHWRKSLSIAKQ